MMTTENIISPKVYCGTYHKYNSGSLKGEWIELEDFDSIEEFYEYCKELHSDEEDPEFMFQDYEAEVRGLISESWINPKLWDLINLDEYEQIQFYAYMEATGYSFEDCLEQYEDMFYFEEEDAWETMRELYPDLQKVYDMNLDFVTVDINRFKEQYTRVKIGGTVYLCDTNF